MSNDDLIHPPRESLVWTIGTRQRLEAWESIVADDLLLEFEKKPRLASPLIWQAQIEHHLTLVAAAHVLRAIEHLAPPVDVDPPLAAGIRELRDLHEHWDENLAVFNRTPRTLQPKYPSGKAFAAKHPARTPYSWLSWSNLTGAQLGPAVTAPDLHDLLDRVEERVLGDEPELAQFLVPRACSPWLIDMRHGRREWWPRPVSMRTTVEPEVVGEPPSSGSSEAN